MSERACEWASEQALRVALSTSLCVWCGVMRVRESERAGLAAADKTYTYVRLSVCVCVCVRSMCVRYEQMNERDCVCLGERRGGAEYLTKQGSC